MTTTLEKEWKYYRIELIWSLVLQGQMYSLEKQEAFLLKCLNAEHWDNLHISRYECVTIEMVLAHPTYPWDYRSLSANPTITWDIVKQHPHLPWDSMMLSINKNITWEIVQQNPQFVWNFRAMSANPNITMEIIKQHPTPSQKSHQDGHWNLSNKWDMKYFSYNPNLQLQDILHHAKSQAWQWEQVTIHPNITLDMILHHSLFWVCWRMDLVSKNPNITIQQIIQHPQFAWNLSDFVRHSKHVPLDMFTFPNKYTRLSSHRYTYDEYVMYNPNAVLLPEQGMPFTTITMAHDLVPFFDNPLHTEKQLFFAKRYKINMLHELIEWYFHPSHYATIRSHGHS